MQKCIALILLAVIIGVSSPFALAESDAKTAFERGRTAYANDQFVEARDLFLKASQTDNRNPEVFLWLGKAQYQLGAVDKAITAWKRTLKLAPEQPYAAKMLSVLRGEAVEIDTRIKLIEVMLRERLHGPALSECLKLLDEKALSELQRPKVMTLQAESLVRMHKGPEARNVLHELTTLYSRQADPVKTTLLLGEAKLQGDERSIAEALVVLRKLVADHPQTPTAARAQYDIITHDPGLASGKARAEAMAKWLAANSEHEFADSGRHILLGAYLSLALKETKPGPESDLSPTDLKALVLAADIYARESSAKKSDELTKRLLSHIRSRYIANKAYTAAIEATETLLAASLPRPNRLSVLYTLNLSKYDIGMKWLKDQAQAGKLPQGIRRGHLPQPLADVLDVYETIHKQYPDVSIWIYHAELAKQVRSFAPKVPPLAEFKGLKGPDAWALDIALPVINANTDVAAVKSAIQTVQAIIDERAKVQKPGSRKLAVDLCLELLEAISPSHQSWSGAMVSYYKVAGNYAHYVFQENIKAGRAEENAKLSEQQKSFLAILKKQAEHKAHSPHVLTLLAEHVKPWVKHGHWSVAENVYTTVTEALPEKEQRQAQLAVVNLWIEQVKIEHQRLIAAGFTVPRELDPTLAKALVRCYELQGGLEEEPSILTQIRDVWNSIVDHYKKLEYFDIAEQAINVRPSETIDTADAYADLQLTNLRFEVANRDLELLLKQYNATEKITLTSAFKEAIEAYQNFISERPSSPLRGQAESSIFKIAEVFVKHKAYDVAVTIYQDFAAFAVKVKVLSQAAPGSSSTAERAAFAAAVAIDAKARMALSKEMKDRKEPPAKISDDFKAAIEAYRNFIKTYPKSVLLGRAIEKNMAVALEYTRVNAWDVADSIYAELLREVPVIRHRQRIEFCRGLCQLGKAIPDHARQVLTTLTLKKITPTTGKDTKSAGEERFDVAEDIASITIVTLPRAVAKPATSAVGGSVSSAEYGSAYQGRAEDLIVNDSRVLAAIRQQEVSRAARVAKLREQLSYQPVPQGQKRQLQAQAQIQAPAQAPVLSDAEISRQQTALNAAYEIFQAIRNKYPATITAEQARGEIKVMIDHWRTLRKWQNAAAMAKRFLKDNPTDKQLPALRLGIARDYLAWAAQPVEDKPSRQLMLGEVAQRFGKARDELAKVVTDFPKERTLLQQAQWDIANSFLTQARVVNAFSTTLARGQYVRAATELQHLADKYYDHPKIGTIPQILWDISGELAKRQYYEEAITVWNDLMIRYPTHNLTQEAALRIAQTYQNNLGQPLRAAEAYQEVNVARGGTDAGIQNAIYQIGVQLKTKKRWVEALHVLEMFVDSFPRHAQAGQALTMIGQIHQTNEAWEDAIAAYRRVIAEFPTGNWVKDAKWSIAECIINLSQWRQAMERYQAYLGDYPGDGRVTEAKRRVSVLKDLARYQTLVDEEGQRKAFDAQYQIAKIVLEQLSNRVKAVIEYRKVVENWPKSHLADDALHAIGTTYLAMGETDKAREAAKSVAKQYPGSPLADDALYMVGKSYEDEANKFAGATRAQTVELAQETAQREAYRNVKAARIKQLNVQLKNISSLKQGGMGQKAELAEAKAAAVNLWGNAANVELEVGRAGQVVEALTAVQLANRQDKINAALRRAVGAYNEASKVAGGDKAGDALLRMATIYYEQLKDSSEAMAAWLEIVRQFSGTSVAEDASWRIAQYYEREGKYAEAIEAYRAFLRNYRRSPKAGDAQFAIAENSEHLGQWIDAMDAYTNYINNFPSGPMLNKAREQINWIKAYRL
ncbi:MAG: tetratricopeptide repeat protein [Planctomycetota bacterium]